MAKKGKAKSKMPAICIVKRKGHCEAYDERKIYGSCYYACRSCHLSEKESEEICSRVCKSLNRLVKYKKEVSSNDIFSLITKELKRHNEDAAFMYATHRDIS